MMPLEREPSRRAFLRMQRLSQGRKDENDPAMQRPGGKTRQTEKVFRFKVLRLGASWRAVGGDRVNDF